MPQLEQCNLLAALEQQGREEGEAPWVAGETWDRKEEAEGSPRKRNPEAFVQVHFTAKLPLKLLRSLTKHVGK